MRETIEVKPEGVYRITKEKLSPSKIANIKRKTQSRIAYYYHKNQEYGDLIERNKHRIELLEATLEDLNDPIIAVIIEKYKEKRRLATMKAEEFLQEFLGDKTFNELKLKRNITFAANDKKTYRIDLKGNVYRKVGSSFERLCVVRPRDLPLPDFIASALITIREKPYSFGRR